MRSHRHGKTIERTKSGKIGGGERRALGGNHGKLIVAVHFRAAMPRNVLHDRQHPARHQPLGRGRSQRRDLGRHVAIGAVADHRIRALDHEIGDRHAIDIDAERTQVPGHGLRAERGRLQAQFRIAIVEPSIRRRRGISRPMRRAETLHPPAFLIHQDRSIAAYRLAKCIGQRADLTGRLDVALEQDEAERPRIT